MSLLFSGTKQVKALCTRKLLTSTSRHQWRSISVKRTENYHREEFTHIIVGAGSAGCVLANRLSARPSNNVLLLEAGIEGTSLRNRIPAAFRYNRSDMTSNWYYHTIPQKYMNNREVYWPRGKVLGGSSMLNSMIYTRGHADDYDRWEREGAIGWSYADCLPYFKRSQWHELGEDDYRGGDGPLHVSRGKSKSAIFDTFIRAGEECGYPFTSDMNGYQQEGFGYVDMTVHKGIRWDAASAYLRSGDVLKRNNLSIISNSFADRILFQGTKAVGIEYTQNNTKEVAVATHDLILSGGSINSPQLLMLSGIGNADELKLLGIPVVSHLPGVGQNLQDHLQVVLNYGTGKSNSFSHLLTKIADGLEWLMFGTSPAATTNLEAGAFLRSHSLTNHPNIQFLLEGSARRENGFNIHLNTLRETSRGYIKLRSSNPKDHPIIDPNYLHTDNDRRDLRQAIKIANDVASQKAFDEFRASAMQGISSTKSDDELDAFIRASATTNYHPSCTCKMGSEDDSMAVVDSETRVFGLDNIRVVDASIMPSNISGNLNAPVIMIAEKVADIILGNTPLKRSNVPVWRPSL
ncbi:choline dehydrogenase, mitochondrial-like [Lytechinus pictus]|uniref:choline dehydrogenase, mitochondrial-like n=1 Tax=Lytechinus pictus TaxID=7653 RepID=UPI0030BA2AB4